MHELLLFGQIQASRHDQVLNILAGVTASQPVSFTEQHLIYAPLKAEIVSSSKKRPQQMNQQLYYHDLSRKPEKPEAFILRINQEPEPGVQNVLSRGYSQQDGLEISKYSDVSLFRFAGQQIFSGHHLVQGNVLLRVYRLLLPKEIPEQPLQPHFPDPDSSTLLDDSGAYIIEASIRLEDKGNVKLTESATKELLDVKRLLQGAIDLQAPDRLLLDNRVKTS